MTEIDDVVEGMAPRESDFGEDSSLDDLVAVQEASEEEEKEPEHLEEIDIEIEDDKPIGIWFVGDVHLGHKEVDYREFEKGLDILKKTDGLYTIWMGDMIENYSFASASKHKDGSSMYEQMMSPQEQLRKIEAILQDIEDKILTILQGDHEAFTFEATGIDIGDHLAKIVDIPYLVHGGVLNLDLSDQTYQILVRHRYRFHSSYNLTHSAKQMMRFLQLADVAAVGHRHEYAVEQTDFQGKDRVFIQIGSYKKTDRYSSRGGYKKLERITPVMVIFYPEERKMIPIQDLELGSEILRYLRKKK